MGYYTQYTIDAHDENGKPIWDEWIAISKFISEQKNRFEWYEFDERLLFDFYIESEPMKWYEHSEDMQLLSQNFPNIRFTLYGHGEDTDDDWVLYAYKGKCYKDYAEKIYPKCPLW